MKRLLIIGATVAALSTTAVVALAGTGPVADIGRHVATQTQGQDIDPIVMKVLDRIQNGWHWQGHAGNEVADRAHQVADPMRDAVREHDADTMRDAADQVRDRAHEVADPARDAVHAQDMDRDRVAAQGRDMAESHLSDHGLDHARDAVDGQDMDRGGNTDRSAGQGHMAGQGRMDR